MSFCCCDSAVEGVDLAPACEWVKLWMVVPTDEAAFEMPCASEGETFSMAASGAVTIICSVLRVEMSPQVCAKANRRGHRNRGNVPRRSPSRAC